MRLNLPLLLLLAIAVPLSAALGSGPEVPVTTPVTAPLPGTQATLAVATDGTDFLALWRDDTPARDGIYATIVTETGARRPAAPLPLLRGLAGVGVHAVWTGSSYLVALQRYLQPALVLTLSRDGQLLSGPRPVDLSDGIYLLAWNGSRALAILRGEAGTTAALLDAEGNVVRAGIAVTGRANDVALTTAGNAFIAVWTEIVEPQNGSVPPKTRARAARISAQGDVSAPVQLLAPVNTYANVDATSNGAEAGVVVETSTAGTVVLHRYTIDASLAVDAEAVQTLEPWVTSNVEVVATSRGFVASWFGTNNEKLSALAFDAMTPTAIELPFAPGSGLNLESNGRAIVAFWGVYPARAAAFDAGLTRLTSAIFPVPAAPVRQDVPVVASAGSTGVVVWNEFGTLKLRRVDGDGHALDAQPVVVATDIATPIDVYYRPVVAFTGKVWLVAYVRNNGGGVQVQRVSPAGALVGEPIATGIVTGQLALASNGVVAALIGALGQNRQGLSLVRFSADGDRLDATPIVLRDERSTDHPSIASNGDGFLAVWNHSAGYTPHLYGKRLDATGHPIEAEPIAIATGPGFSHSWAQVASNGEDYLVAFVRFGEIEIYDPPIDVPHPEPERVFAKRVLDTGVLADTTADQDGTEIGLGTNPALTVDDSRYVATFTRRDADTLWLYAVPLHPYGEPLAPPRLIVRADSHAQEHSIASIGGSLLTAYSRVVPELTSVQRVFLREVTEQQTTRRRGSRN